MKHLKKFKNFLNKILNRKIKVYGNFNNWQDALDKSKGYDDDEIFKIKKKSFEKVISGEALYERDSYLFFKKKHDKFLVTRLNNLKKTLNRKIKICDFGGSFGSLYFQHRDIFLKNFIEWNVYEQKKYVDYINNRIRIDNLNFFHNLKNLNSKKEFDLVLFSSVLHYLEDPYQILEIFLKKKIKEIIIMRTPFFLNYDEIKIQSVPQHIYNSSYPVRIINLTKVKNIFKEFKYELIHQENINEKIDIYDYTNLHFIKKLF